MLLVPTKKTEALQLNQQFKESAAKGMLAVVHGFMLEVWI